MAVVDVINIAGEVVTQTELNETIFNVPVKKSVLHQVVTAQLAGRRAGSASVKRRSDVRGSRHKLYRQKGTGRARKGDIKSPVLRGGGVVFGPDPRDYSKKVLKKVRKLALKMALSSKVQEQQLIVVDRIDLDEIKTRVFAGIVKTIDATKALIVTGEKNERLELSSRNIPGVKILQTEGLNVYDILKYPKLVILQPAIEGIEGRLG
ncbi:50S ribosomal protein L4 [Desulfosarcina ovata]|uniref:Large ribosomal subunit protein uL4 n=2 Tax=Desulfosarcina ovata TaxID=83564 RepID=A0A5K8AJ23_9BACT|nr:50S ribosomal protein L4 [Desulfosarcina ovata]BBO85543.1 50S ribosomal protein L4 [Desulfosarcina ovata subsp. sediminis]BBO92578.1 50S ribosomal protein L4 [Desulfosarcina ovata subsp. ovata]